MESSENSKQSVAVGLVSSKLCRTSTRHRNFLPKLALAVTALAAGFIVHAALEQMRFRHEKSFASPEHEYLWRANRADQSAPRVAIADRQRNSDEQYSQVQSVEDLVGALEEAKHAMPRNDDGAAETTIPNPLALEDESPTAPVAYYADEQDDPSDPSTDPSTAASTVQPALATSDTLENAPIATPTEATEELAGNHSPQEQPDSQPLRAIAPMSQAEDNPESTHYLPPEHGESLTHAPTDAEQLPIAPEKQLAAAIADVDLITTPESLNAESNRLATSPGNQEEPVGVLSEDEIVDDALIEAPSSGADVVEVSTSQSEAASLASTQLADAMVEYDQAFAVVESDAESVSKTQARRYYSALARLVEVTWQLESDLGRQRLVQVHQHPKLMRLIATATPSWLRWEERGSTGVVVVGEVQSAIPREHGYELTVQAQDRRASELELFVEDFDFPSHSGRTMVFYGVTNAPDATGKDIIHARLAAIAP